MRTHTPSPPPCRGARHRRLVGALVVGAGLWLTGAGTASAAMTAGLTPDGRHLDVNGGPGAAVDNLRISITHDDAGRQVIDMFAFDGVDPGPGCAADGASVRCKDPELQVRIRTGDGDDKVMIDDTQLAFGPGSLDIDLGAGRDLYEADQESGEPVVNGGPGDDQLNGGLRSDVLDGGPGNDVVYGAEGADTVRGGDGDDTLTGDGPSERGISPDVVDGGAGSDLLDDYVFSGDPARAPAIDVSFDGQANDGRADERDNVMGVERVNARSAGSFTGDDADNEFTAPETGASGRLSGRGGNDLLIAGDANGDALDGGTGDDTLEGGFGDDTLTGGPGRDTIAGDRKSRCNEYSCDLVASGNDTIEARDGEVDSISCGIGTDRVVADAADAIDATCETVERSAPGTKPPGGGKTDGGKSDGAKTDGGKTGGGKTDGGKSDGQGDGGTTLSVARRSLRTALSRGLRVTVTGASGRVTLKATSKGRTLARGTATAKSGRAVVVLKFTQAAKRKLRRARRVSLRISGADATRIVSLKR